MSELTPEGEFLEQLRKKLELPLDLSGYRFRTVEEQNIIRAEHEAEKAAGWTGDPQPYLYPDGCREETPIHVGDSPEHSRVEFRPRSFKKYQEEENSSLAVDAFIEAQEAQIKRLKGLREAVPPAIVAKSDQWSAFTRHWMETMQSDLIQGVFDPLELGRRMGVGIEELCPTESEKVAFAMQAVMLLAINLSADEVRFP